MKWFPWKSRKYPIIRDEYGRSARQQAFELFWEGYRPAQIHKQKLIHVPIKTLFTYFEQWKKLNDRVSYSTMRKWMKKKPEFSEKVITMLADYLGMSREEVIIRRQKPWGLMQAMKGKWPNYRIKREQNEIESRLQGALELILLAERFGNDREEFRKEIMKLLSKKRKIDKSP